MVASNTPDDELTELFTRVGRIQFIGIWAGENYYTSYTIALLLMIPITIALIQNTGIEVQRAKNMHQFRSWIYLVMAVGNVILSIPLSIRYGGVGAAIGTFISIF